MASENATPQHRALTSDCAEKDSADEEVNHIDQTNEAQLFLERLTTDEVGLFPGIGPVRFFVPQYFYLGDWEE